ncbi:unnamed protein product [Lymnaea stagnalis]|uniref:Mitochondrial GTPase 1 n=1 Tax=Lymnaea stagnalis TaxID=6523 RepID=A0AAV2IFR8_LYMST
MSNKYMHLKNTFRKTFYISNSQAVKWYPGHMQKGLFQIQAKLQKVDCIIEIHDARVPFSGRNNRFRDIIKMRPHILLLNKIDLTDLQDNNKKREKIMTQLQKDGVDTTYFTNLRNNQNEHFLQSTILPSAKELIGQRPRYNREGAEDFNFLVIGLPNVGKSTFINSLRSTQLTTKGKATTVGAIAGITRSVLNKIKVSTHPNVYIIDTPGIMPPKVENIETGMKLAACSSVPDHIIGEVHIADYILYWLNKHEHFSYVDYFQLDAPIDNVLQVLANIAVKNRKVSHIKDMSTNQLVYRPNIQMAATMFIKAFREGHLGRFTLDTII